LNTKCKGEFYFNKKTTQILLANRLSNRQLSTFGCWNEVTLLLFLLMQKKIWTSQNILWLPWS